MNAFHRSLSGASILGRKEIRVLEKAKTEVTEDSTGTEKMYAEDQWPEELLETKEVISEIQNSAPETLEKNRTTIVANLAQSDWFSQSRPRLCPHE